jgi:hypothetical protein
VVAALLALVLAHGVALADDVGLVVSGGDGARLHDDLEKHLARWLKKRGFTPVKTALDDDAITTIANCLVVADPKCAGGVVDARSTLPTVVFAKIDAGPNHDITFTTYWFVKGRPATGQQRACPACAGDAWRALVDETMNVLRTDVGTAVTAGPIPVEPPPPPPSPPPSHALPLVLLGGGVASLGASGVFFYYAAKGGPHEKFIYPDSKGWGIATAVVGAGLAIGGAVMWHQRSSAPVAAIDSHGAYVGWITSF